MVSLVGALMGVFFLALAVPPVDFFYLLPVLALIGVIVANFALMIVLQANFGFEF